MNELIGKKSSRHWTESEDGRLVELRREGLQVKQIAAHLGRSPRAVEDRIILLRKAGAAGVERYARQVFTEDHDRIIGEMYAAGASYAGIAAATGLTPDQIKGRLRVLKDRRNIAGTRDLATADIQGGLHARKAGDSETEEATRQRAAKGQAGEDREWLRDEVKRYLREWKAAKRQPGFAIPRGPEHYREAQRIGMEELSERIRRNRRQAVA